MEVSLSIPAKQRSHNYLWYYRTEIKGQCVRYCSPALTGDPVSTKNAERTHTNGPVSGPSGSANHTRLLSCKPGKHSMPPAVSRPPLLEGFNWSTRGSRASMIANSCAEKGREEDKRRKYQCIQVQVNRLTRGQATKKRRNDNDNISHYTSGK